MINPVQKPAEFENEITAQISNNPFYDPAQSEANWALYPEESRANWNNYWKQGYKEYLNSEYARVSANFRTTEAGANVGMAIPGWATFATFAVTGPLRLIASGILAGSTSEGGFSGCGALASLGGGALRKGAAVANSIEKKSAFEAEPSGAGGGGPSGNGPPSAPLEPSYGPYRHGLNKGGLNDVVTNQRLLSTEASSIAGGKLA